MAVVSISSLTKTTSQSLELSMSNVTRVQDLFSSKCQNVTHNLYQAPTFVCPECTLQPDLSLLRAFDEVVRKTEDRLFASMITIRSARTLMDFQDISHRGLLVEILGVKLQASSRKMLEDFVLTHPLLKEKE